ncbi:MAG: Uma2 family endonuclease [Planctomycetota bacterium]
MIRKQPVQDSYVVLHGIPWKMYEGILDALGEYHLRHTYVSGALEMRSLLHGVSWQDYMKLLDVFGDRTLRHTYDRGELELMSPRKDHDWIKSFIGRMIETIAFSFDIEIQCIGSTTLTGEAVEKGFQPDEAYYVANEAVVRGKKTYDPDVDPPPDLLVEVDVTLSSLNRMPGFAALKINEVWRHDGESMHFYQLTASGDYETLDCSLAFPFVEPSDIDRQLEKLDKLSENTVLRQLIDELRPRLNTTND